MRAETICQGQSHSSVFIWLDLSSLYNSIQSSSCWHRLSGSSQHNALPRPAHSLQLLWTEKRTRTAQDQKERKGTTDEKAEGLIALCSAGHLPRVRGWTCVLAIRKADDENNKRCAFISTAGFHLWIRFHSMLANKVGLYVDKRLCLSTLILFNWSGVKIIARPVSKHQRLLMG